MKTPQMKTNDSISLSQIVNGVSGIFFSRLFYFDSNFPAQPLTQSTKCIFGSAHNNNFHPNKAQWNNKMHV